MKTRWNNCFRSLPLVSPLCPPLFSVLFSSLLFSFLPSPSYPYSHCQDTLPPSNVPPLSPSYTTIQSSYTILPFSFMLDILMNRSHNISTPHRPALFVPISVHTAHPSPPLSYSPLILSSLLFSSPPLLAAYRLSWWDTMHPDLWKHLPLSVPHPLLRTYQESLDTSDC